MKIGNLAYCKAAISPLRQEASDRSEMVSQIVFGEVIQILETQFPWILVETQLDGYTGWCDWKQFQVISPKEAKRWMDGLQIQANLLVELNTPWGNQWVSRGSYIPDSGTFHIGNDEFEVKQVLGDKPLLQIDSLAKSYLNAPYLWGGKTIFGIDCSGFTQQVFRFLDINMPRDAYQQAELGQTIDWEDRQSGDLAFFINSSQKIHHVGILLNDSEIIHASGCVRIDEFTQKGIYNRDLEQQTHELYMLKRL